MTRLMRRRGRMKAQGEIVTWDSGPEDTGMPRLRNTEGILHITKSSSMILFLAIFVFIRTLIQISYLNISHLMSNWQSVSFQWRDENIATHAPRTQSRHRPTLELEDRLSASQRARSNLNMSLSPDDTPVMSPHLVPSSQRIQPPGLTTLPPTRGRNCLCVCWWLVML